MSAWKAVVRAGLVLIHLIFLAATLFAAVDLAAYQHRASEGWSGIFFYGISLVLGFPWSYGIGLLASKLKPLPPLGLLGVGLVINYVLLIALTLRVWKGKDPPSRPSSP
jgi:hypothetical protein